MPTLAVPIGNILGTLYQSVHIQLWISVKGNEKTVAPIAAAPIGNILGAPAVGAIKAEGKESTRRKVGDQGIGAA